MALSLSLEAPGFSFVDLQEANNVRAILESRSGILIDDLDALRNREPKTRSAEIRIRGEARDHDVASQSVRRLEVELPDARVVVVDPNLRAGERRVRALGHQRYRVRRPARKSSASG